MELKEKELTEKIIGALIEVHRYWGPGLYEEIYERSAAKELNLRGISFKTQMPIPLVYKGEKIGDDLKLDLIVEDRVVVEMKAVKDILPVHDAQTLTYMRLTGCPVGLLVNFNVHLLMKGLRRFVL